MAATPFKFCSSFPKPLSIPLLALDNVTTRPTRLLPTPPSPYLTQDQLAALATAQHNLMLMELALATARAAQAMATVQDQPPTTPPIISHAPAHATALPTTNDQSPPTRRLSSPRSGPSSRLGSPSHA